MIYCDYCVMSFKTLYLGEYDPINIFDFEDEGSAHHFIYIGIKE
ncbi:hypothetical protein [Campylobacter volucris]|nr:hypothetical protein [Campylobacter volucris]